MIAGRFVDSAGKPTLVGKIGSWLLVIPSIVVGIIAVELFCRWLPSSVDTNNITDTQRVIFFDGPAEIF